MIEKWNLNSSLSGRNSFFDSITNSQVVILLWCSDYFLANKPLQPKREIAEYVASEWFRIPKVYDNLEEAQESGEDYVVRSEHPWHYTSRDESFESYCIFPENSKNRLRLIQEEKKRQERRRHMPTVLRSFERKYWKTYEEFYKNAGYSYWKFIEGTNHYIIEDQDVSGRFYIFSDVYKKKKKYKRILSIIERNEVYSFQGYYREHDTWKYAFFDSDSIEEISGRCISVWLEELYSQIKGLPNFDQSNCPVMEIQEDNEGDFYFLQYHRIKENNGISRPPFILNRSCEEWEEEIKCIRWVTPEAWRILEFKWWWEEFDDKINIEWIDNEYGFADLLWKWMHFGIERIFKNDIFIEDFINGLLNKWSWGEKFTFWDLSWKEVSCYTVAHVVKIISYIQNEYFSIPIRLISDGRKAYVKVMMDFWDFKEKFRSTVEDSMHPLRVLKERGHDRWKNAIDIFSSSYTIKNVIK